jgi:hypothetical protein
MKKLLIGCGVLFALGLGVLGILAWKLGPAIEEAMVEAGELHQRLETLEEDYPFDAEAQSELDTEHFSTCIDIHVGIKSNLDTWTAEMQSYEAKVEEQDIGLLDQFKNSFSGLPRLYRLVVPVLEEHKLSLSEFSYHTRVLWATLALISAGVESDPKLDSLRLLYSKLEADYEKVRSEGSTPLEQLIGEFDPSDLKLARNILKLDPEKVERAILITNAELIFMSLVTGPASDEAGYPAPGDWNFAEPEGQ